MLNDASNVIAFGGNTMVYESIKRHALKELQQLIRVLMENVDDALFELSEKVDNDRERTMYFDAMRMVRLKRQAIEQGFDDAMQQAFDDLILERASRKPAGGGDELELSLVAHDVIEDQLAIESMISRARPLFEDDLFALRERLRTVLHRKRIDPELNPFDPKAICESFHQACSVLDTEIEVKLILYKLFEKFVMRSLDDFYRNNNDYFVQKGVLPDLKASQERLNESARMARRFPRGAAPAGGSAQIPGEPDPLTPGAESTATADESLLSMLQQALMPGGAGATGAAPAAGAVATGGLAGGASAGLAQGLFTALQGLQQAPVTSVPLGQVTPVEMKAQLQQQISLFREENRDQVSASEDQIIDIVSMLFDFFFDDKALPDPVKVLIGRLQIPILKVAMLDKSFFNSKKHPARKLLDSISKASLGWSEEAEQEQVLVAEIERIVNFLIDEFGQDVGVFEQALNEFETFREQERQRVEQQLESMKQQELQREEQLQLARRAANELVGKLVDGRDLSFDVIEFLQGVWLQVLVNTWVTEGESSNHWKNLQRITSTLVWTLIPKDSEEQRKKLLDTLPPLLRALSKGMELIQTDAEERNRVFQMLVLEHAKVMKQTSRNIVTRVDDETIWPESGMAAAFAESSQEDRGEGEVDIYLDAETGDEIIEVEEGSIESIGHSETESVIRNLEEFTSCVQQGEIDVDEEIVMASEPDIVVESASSGPSEAALETVAGLAVGDWIEFRQENGEWQHARLSWKSNVTGKLVFVNRHGQKLRDTRLRKLAEEFTSGQARQLESSSVFDRAIHSILSGLRS